MARPCHGGWDSRDTGAAAAGLTWSKEHIHFLQSTLSTHMGGPHRGVPRGMPTPGPLSEVPRPQPPPRHPSPLLFSLRRGHPCREFSPSPAQGTWPAYWPECDSRNTSPFGNHEGPDLRSPSGWTGEQEARPALLPGGGHTSSSCGTNLGDPATRTQDSGCLQLPLCPWLCDLGQNLLRISRQKQQSNHQEWPLLLQPPYPTQSRPAWTAEWAWPCYHPWSPGCMDPAGVSAKPQAQSVLPPNPGDAPPSPPGPQGGAMSTQQPSQGDRRCPPGVRSGGTGEGGAERAQVPRTCPVHSPAAVLREAAGPQRHEGPTEHGASRGCGLREERQHVPALPEVPELTLPAPHSWVN